MEVAANKETIAVIVCVCSCAFVSVCHHNRIVPREAPGGGGEEVVPALLQGRLRLRQQTSVSV